MSLINGRGRFSTPPHSSETWVVSENSQFDARTFLFFPYFVMPTGPTHFCTSPRTIRHYTSFPPGSAFWVRNMKVEMWPLLPSKNVKMGLSWRSMENFSRRNPGTVSRIQFKLGIGVDHISGISWYDSKIKRSRPQGHVTYLNKKCNNSVLGSPINFILGD